MAADKGKAQEERLVDYLKFQRFCVETLRGEDDIRSFLGMKEQSNCADVLGFHQDANSPGPKRITVAESKGNDLDTAVKQLGNAAAGVFEKFGRGTKVELLVMVPTLVHVQGGHLSPSGGYRAEPAKTGLNKFTLHKWTYDEDAKAKPDVTYEPWRKWSSLVGSLAIVIFALHVPPPHRTHALGRSNG